jgi:hypothetical protein
MSDVIKAVEFKGKSFDTKEDLFKELKANKKELIGLKTAEVKHSAPLSMSLNKLETAKAIDGLDKGYIYPVINTTKYMDSHNDVHLDGIWNRSIGDQVGKVHYLINHELEVGKVIAYPKDVEVLVKDVLWTDLGANYSGYTQALIFKTNVFDYSNIDAKKIIKEEIEIQHSVRMQYVKIDLAINSTAEDTIEEKAVWEKYISEIANKEAVIEQGYFWAVTEAKIYKEGSMVLAGSNDITPMIYPTKDIQSSNDIDKTDSSNDNQTNEVLNEEAKRELLLQLIKN